MKLGDFDSHRSGQKEQAIQLCRMLLQHSDDNRAALEMTLHHLGAPQEGMKEVKPLVVGLIASGTKESLNSGGSDF